MLRFMALCFIATFTFLLEGLVGLAMATGVLFAATPIAYIGWHLLFARHDYSN